jgi:hypothetical protein
MGTATVFSRPALPSTSSPANELPGLAGQAGKSYCATVIHKLPILPKKSGDSLTFFYSLRRKDLRIFEQNKMFCKYLKCT